MENKEKYKDDIRAGTTEKLDNNREGKGRIMWRAMKSKQFKKYIPIDK